MATRRRKLLTLDCRRFRLTTDARVVNGLPELDRREFRRRAPEKDDDAVTLVLDVDVDDTMSGRLHTSDGGRRTRPRGGLCEFSDGGSRPENHDPFTSDHGRTGGDEE